MAGAKYEFFPVGTRVQFFWRPSNATLTGDVVDHATFHGLTRYGVWVTETIPGDPTGSVAGRTYDVWPDMDLKAV